MARNLLIKTDFLPYHVTARSNNREDFALPLEQVWEILTNECLLAVYRQGIEIHALTLMPNHFHLILTVPIGDLGQVMKSFMRDVTRIMNLKSGRSGHVFGGPYFRSLIGSGIYYRHAIKYVYRNPAKAGLAERVEDWPWSTIHGLVGKSRLPFPLFYPRSGHGQSIPWDDFDRVLQWLNRPFAPEAAEAVRRALRKRQFTLPMVRRFRAPIEIVDQL